MLPDRVSNPGPLTYESGALPIALRGPAVSTIKLKNKNDFLICHRVWKTAKSQGILSWMVNGNPGYIL